MSKLERLLFIRKRLANDIKHQTAIIDKLDSDSPLPILISRKEALEDLWSDFKTNQDQIENNNSWIGSDEFITQSTELHDEYVKSLTKFLELLPEDADFHNSLHACRTNRNQQTDESAIDANAFSDANRNEGNMENNGNRINNNVHNSTSLPVLNGLPARVKLPALEITKFSGNLIDWPEFKASCEGTFTRAMDDISRFRYLKSNLSGEAGRMVKHLPLNATSYDKAWQLLTKRYDNERAIINANLKRLIDLPFLKNESEDDLKRMLNTTNECIAAINSYNIDTSSWDAILIFLLSQRLDPINIKHWEEQIQAQKTIPGLNKLLDFLEMRINILETTASVHSYNRTNDKRTKVLLNAEMNKKCTICQGNHFAYTCAMLTNKQDDEKIVFVKSKGLCINCFHNHNVDECTSRFSCKICGQRHNSILHTAASVFCINTENSEPNEELTSEMDQEELQAHEMASIFAIPSNSITQNQVILATALIKIEFNNRSLCVKALIDQGSTTNLISKRTCRALNLRETPIDVPITGIGGHVSCKVKTRTNFTIHSMVNKKFSTRISALVVPKITTLKSINVTDDWLHLKNLPLADPNMHEFNRIDVLLGAATFAQIIAHGLIKGKTGQPIAQKTELGWIISGSTQNDMHQPLTPVFTLNISNDDLSNQLKGFWENEDIPKGKILTPDEKLAEEIYANTTKRCTDGKYMVRLPFKSNTSPEFTNSFSIAQRRYNSMMKRFKEKSELRNSYDKCIQEYLDLNHMEIVENPKEPRYFLPHHPVFKESSTTTKIRPVFDASCKSTNGISLNSELLIGPTIQTDLFSLLISWRKNKYVITGDVEKMYRQIWIHPDDANYQCILWEQNNELKSYRLKTVTFGVASAPFLAIRSLHQIGNDIEKTNPLIAEKIKKQFYVDDYFDSVESIAEAKQIVSQISNTLAEYGFPMRKWKSNHPEILEDLPTDEKDSSPCNTFKTLGIQWQPDTDEFIFLPTPISNKPNWTKRTVLSEICKIFDPLGWLSPCVILAKIFMQKLWLLQLSWDEQIPYETAMEWKHIRTQLIATCSMKIPRWIGMSSDAKDIMLHGFADASEKAYACVVYVRIIHFDDSVSCKLIAAKTRVAPLKKISIPRLELNAAVLLAVLIEKIRKTLKISLSQIHAWTDSMIVLYWLADHPSRWKTYVAQRVSEIQNTLPSYTWRHIDSQHNPADCASRGLELIKLEEFKMWWHGPDFLIRQELEWPKRTIIRPSNQNLEEKRQSIKIHHLDTDENKSIINQFSTYDKLLRILMICFRWSTKTRSRKCSTTTLPNETEEMIETEKKLIRLIQTESFQCEKLALSTKKPLSYNSKIKNLDPYIDDSQILRVGGRLQHSKLLETEKHQIILPQGHHFTKLLIRRAHEMTMHGGRALMMQYIQQKFWIIGCRKECASVIHNCIICFRFKKNLLTQKMGNIPSYRLQEALPFTYTGVDYAGYFEIKSSQRKNAPYIKAYVAVFICLTTRAMHLELVSDLTTNQFLKAFKRFINRRGMPSKIFSDNATNFIGAERQIHESIEQCLNQTNSDLRQELLKKRIIWETIPARAPHFGGWESGVKLFKHHLKRTLINVRLCFEDFNTLITDIEAIVNSRPLWSVPTRPDEFEALTPGHFLVFRALTTLPEPSTTNIPSNRLDHYQYLQQLRSDFWKVWAKEYLQTLQIRKKWQTTKPNVRVGQIVLVSEDNEYPTQWSLGKITKIYHGTDGLVRVADVFCRGKILQRPIHKLSLLPIIDNEQPTDNSS